MIRKRADIEQAVRLFSCELIKLFSGSGDTLARGSGHAADGRGREAEAPHALYDRSVLLLHADKREILLRLVLLDEEQLRFLSDRGQRALHCGKIGAPRNGSQHHRASLCAGSLKRQIKFCPRRQRVDVAALTAFLRADAFDAILVGGYLLRHGARRAYAAVIQQDVLADLRLRAEHRFFLRHMPVENIHGADKRRMLSLEGHKPAAFARYKILEVGILYLSLDLGELHAAPADKLLQQRILVGTDNHEPQLFHSFNGH